GRFASCKPGEPHLPVGGRPGRSARSHPFRRREHTGREGRTNRGQPRRSARALPQGSAWDHHRTGRAGRRPPWGACMKLYYAPASPYARKVRVAANRLGVNLELVQVNPLAVDNAYGQVNPVNRVPSLKLDDGTVLFDSPVICEYLDATYGPLL